MNNDLPPFQKNNQCFSVLRRATRLLEETGLTQAEIHKNANLNISYQSFNKFVTGENKNFSRGKEGAGT